MYERFFKRFVNCIAFICVLGLLVNPCIANAGSDEELTKIDFTCYIDRGVTFSGCQTRKGIAAASEELIGYTAIVYTTDYELIGIYEIKDKIGTKWGRSGTIDNPHVIDIWCESLEEAKEMMKLTDGKCLVKIIWAEG